MPGAENHERPPGQPEPSVCPWAVGKSQARRLLTLTFSARKQPSGEHRPGRLSGSPQRPCLVSNVFEASDLDLLSEFFCAPRPTAKKSLSFSPDPRGSVRGFACQLWLFRLATQTHSTGVPARPATSAGHSQHIPSAGTSLSHRSHIPVLIPLSLLCMLNILERVWPPSCGLGGPKADCTPLLHFVQFVAHQVYVCPCPPVVVNRPQPTRERDI